MGSHNPRFQHNRPNIVFGTTNQCGKRAYLSRKEARKATRRLKQEGKGDRMREYRCPDCDRWHIGHLPQRVYRGDMSADEFYGRS